MGRALSSAFPEARAVLDAADDALGFRISTLCAEGPDAELKRTANTQPAIVAVSLAAQAVFSARSPEAPAFVAGHSLGEYAALVAAGGFSLRDALRLVRARGTFMQEAVPEGVGAMAAVIGAPAEVVQRVCGEAAQGEVLAPANFNEPNQTVIAGHAAAVARATPLLKAAGAKRVLPLPVSAPFHCALMEPVVGRMNEALANVTVSPLKVQVVTNVEAAPNSDASKVKPLLLQQITGAVRWVETVHFLEQAGVTHVIELGPGKVLSGLVKRIAPSIRLSNVEDPQSLEQALQ
ncbi:MAG: ACP S-malonyltransferase [Archangium sp.]|nr:ACP S-malonyltransferase [Archangium sp.]